MKKIIFLISFLFLPYLIISQEESTLIKVSARAVHIDASPEYKATVSLSNTYSSLPSEMTTMEILKKQYKEVLNTNGISWDELKENPNDFGYESMGYGKKGTLFEYRTKSVDKMKTFLGIKSLGLQYIDYVSIITIDTNEVTKLIDEALATAKTRATIIATSMGKKLGNIKEIEDLNNRYGDEIESSIFYDRPSAEYFYMINVIFTVM